MFEEVYGGGGVQSASAFGRHIAIWEVWPWNCEVSVETVCNRIMAEVQQRAERVRKWVESENERQRERERGLLSSALFGAAGLSLARREAHIQGQIRNSKTKMKIVRCMGYSEYLYLNIYSLTLAGMLMLIFMDFLSLMSCSLQWITQKNSNQSKTFELSVWISLMTHWLNQKTVIVYPPLYIAHDETNSYVMTTLRGISMAMYMTMVMCLLLAE